MLIQVTVADDNFPAYRTITPAAWDDTRKAKLSYTIYQDDALTQVFNGFDNIKWDDIKNGYHMAIGQTTAPLKLIMVARETTSGKIALISYKTDVTVPSSNLINFVLRPYRNTQAESDDATKGSVDITLKFVDPEKNPDDPIKEAKCELKLAPGTSIGAPIAGVMCNVMSGDIISYQQPEVAPGVYEFTAELLRTSGKSAGKASSLVIVDPANESKDTLQIVRDLNTKPNAPKNLQVQYARPGDGDTTYKATFTWQDESYNEDEFVLTFYKKDGTKYDPQPTVTTDPPATAPHMIDRNVHTATATLKLGEQYKVSVKAKNEFGSSNEVQLSDLKTDNIVHLARITYKLNGGKVLNAAETTSSYYIAEDTDPANPAIGYYTGFKLGIPVMLPAEVLSTETGIPASVYHPFKPTGGTGGIDKLYTFKGWTGTAVAGNPNPGFQLTDGQIASDIEVEAIWEEYDPLSITFPAYDEYCYIEGQNKILDAEKGKPCNNIKANVICEPGYTIAETKWYADGAEVPGQTSDTFAGSFNTPGLKHLMVVMKLTKADAPDKWVSARCYVRVK